MIKVFGTLAAIALSTGINAQTVVHSEDFQSGIPAGYTIVDNDGLTPHASVTDFTPAWISIVDPDDPSGNDTVAASTSYFEPIATADRWLITPAITLGTYGNFLYWEGKSHDASHPDGYFVLASKTDTQLSSFTDTLMIVAAELDEWTSHEINLSDSLLDNETVHIAFVNRTYDGFKLYLNNISVESEDPVGIDELAQQYITLYPNPATNVLNIQGAKAEEIQVYGINGTLLVSESNATSVDVAHLSPGNYLITIQRDGHIYRQKFIKE